MTDEAKRCVEALRWSHYHDACTDENDTCPVKDECFRCDSVLCNVRIAADLIESLSAQLEQVTRERDAAVEAVKRIGACNYCIHDTFCKEEFPICMRCKRACPCHSCSHQSNWQWCGAEANQ